MLRLLILIVLSCSASSALAQETGSALPYSSVYEHERSEQLIARGLLQMEAKDFRTAEKTFLEAVQVAKVNYGLRAPQQRAALEHLIEALLAQQKWQLAGDQLSYFEWLNDEIYLRDFYDYLRGTKQLSELLYRASADAENSNSTRYLILAKNLSWRAISAIEATLGETDPELVPWLYDVVLAHYYQVSLIKRRSLLNEVTAQENSVQYQGWTLAKSESLRISYRIGRDLLSRIQQILSAGQDSPTEASALAVIYQADWELLFGHEAIAMTLYGEANRQLSSIGALSERLNQLFGQPRVLPDPVLYTSLNRLEAALAQGPIQFRAWTPNYPGAQLPSAKVALADRAQPSSALVEFTLLPAPPIALMGNRRIIKLGFGLRNVDVLEITPRASALANEVRYQMSLLQLRPALKDGSPVEMDGLQLRYHFAPQQELPNSRES